MTTYAKITKPQNCLLAIALPLTKDDFIHDLRLDSPKDYAKTRQYKYDWEIEALWELDHLPMVKLIQKTAMELSKMGCRVQFDFKVADLALIESYDVVTIVTHWNSQSNLIEFYDGMMSIEQVIDKIPVHFRGIFDLTICCSTALQDAIKKHRPSTLVIANKHPTSLDFRLLFYKTTIKMLYAKDLNYIDAVADLRIEFIKNQNTKIYEKSQSHFKKVFQLFKALRHRRNPNPHI